MDSLDSANLLSGGSRLLSQSPQFSFDSAGSSTHTGPGGDDLSLSELCLDDDSLPTTTKKAPQTAAGRHPKTRPSIAQALGFGAPLEDRSEDPSVLDVLQEGEEEAGVGVGVGEDEEGAEGDVTVRVGDEAADGVYRTSIAAQSREEKLQSDLFVLRQLNCAFAVYNDALREAQGGTEVSYSCFYIYRLFRVNFLLYSHTTTMFQAPRRAARANRRTTQQIHQHPIQVRAGQPAHIRRAMDGRRGGTRVLPPLSC